MLVDLLEHLGLRPLAKIPVAELRKFLAADSI
jgi:hypothetical protein